MTQGATRDRSVRLFQLLEEIERLRAKRVRTLSTYAPSTQPPTGLQWLSELPSEQEVRSVLSGDLPHDGTVVLECDRPRIPHEPELPPILRGKVDGAGSEAPEVEPQLRPAGELATEASDSDHAEGVVEAFESYRSAWREWVAEVQRVRPVRDLYRQLFRLHENLEQYPEELHASVVVGCLSWNPEDHELVRRHLLSMPSTITFDAESGRIAVEINELREVEVEVDMLDPVRQPRTTLLDEVRADLKDLETSLLHHEAVDPALSKLANALAEDGSYEAEVVDPTTPRLWPVVTFAPAVVVRRRRADRKLRVLAEIVEQLRDESVQVPPGVRSLVEPVDPDEGRPRLDPGQLSSYETYLPLAANDQQREIVWSVENRQHTVVVGPPGTGKTHTIANVLAHLLAQGNRVLITAETERALREVREKLPAQLRDLVIAVVGQSRDDRAEMARSVNEMTSFVDEYQPPAEREAIDRLEERVDRLRRRQSEIRSELVEAKVAAVDAQSVGSYHGSLAEVAQQLAEQAGRFDWLLDEDPPDAAPLSHAEALELLQLLRDGRIDADRPEIEAGLPEPGRLPDPVAFAQQVRAVESAEQAVNDAAHLRDHPAYPRVASLDTANLEDLAGRLEAVAAAVERARQRSEPWMQGLLRDAADAKLEVWHRRAGQLVDDLDRADELVQQLGQVPVYCPKSVPRGHFEAQARRLRDYLAQGRRVRRVLRPKPVKYAEQFLEQVTVGGEIPDTLERVEQFLLWAELVTTIEQSEKVWPAGTEVPDEDTLVERLGWLRAETTVLNEALDIADRLGGLQRAWYDHGLPPPGDWIDVAELRLLADVCREPGLRATAHDARRPFEWLAAELDGYSAIAAREVRHAVVGRDVERYAAAYTRLATLTDLRDGFQRRQTLLERLAATLPRVTEQLLAEPDDERWDQRLPELQQACDWRRSRRVLLGRLAGDPTPQLLEELETNATELRQCLLELTTRLAWSRAVDRLDERQRRSLNQYAYLASRVSKAGRYRARELRNSRDALRACRDAVPAWIMPINQVADVLEMDPDAFDVVIVDEASQAGLDSVFLQYLAPKMVVIGDHLQVSPTSFLERAQLHSLVDQYLADFDDKATWENPETSLFDHARMRFSQRIVLREHFRSVPEIIRYSQRHVYEPEGITLVPLRQYGTDRLPPIRTEHVRDGYRTGYLNPPEIDAVVEAVAKCCADPAYEHVDADGKPRKKTFGVISLIGSDQARQIETRLLNRIGEQEYVERAMRCGDARDFQGSQRDVMFLSLVEAPPEDGSAIRAQTKQDLRQRLNVAASRARDQQWLFHSVLPEQLNPQDLRTPLLRHCLTVIAWFGNQEATVPAPVSEDVLDGQRFDSLFEQRVFNRIVERGFVVEPQVQVGSRRIDLVVVGAESRLAVECDGDVWHGPDDYAKDIARQRELERADWTFVRIRESEFYANRSAALDPLWATLDEHGIEPPALQTSSDASSEPEPSTSPEPPSDPELPATTSEASPDETPAASRLAATPTRVSLMSPQPASTGADTHGPSESTDPVSEAVAGSTGDKSDSPPPVAAATREDPHWDRAGSAAQCAPIDLAPYREWDVTTPLGDPHATTPSDRLTGLARIVEVEGPIVGERLYRLYVKSAGRSRAGRELRRLLNVSSSAAVSRGVLVADNPLGATGQTTKTFRLPDQPEVAVRELGPRTIHEVPPAELAAVLAMLRDPGHDREQWFRAVLDLYGLVRLTEATRDYLQACSTLINER